MSRDLEDRATLEAEATAAEAQNRTGEAWLLRTRLQRGDFQDGDRIVVRLLGTTTFNDTITVRAGKMLPLPRMDDLPLEGVLRSELTPRLSSHLARYLRDSSVRATPLLRLAVLGQVRAPGYYYTSADVLLSDVIMKAGGPAPDADMNKSIIRRGGETIWNAQDTRTALSDGLSLDRLHLRAGDEIYLPEQHHFNWGMATQIAFGVLGLAVALVRFH
jgi:protein involved in polysaccharide export with SLBB domain